MNQCWFSCFGASATTKIGEKEMNKGTLLTPWIQLNIAVTVHAYHVSGIFFIRFPVKSFCTILCFLFTPLSSVIFHSFGRNQRSFCPSKRSQWRSTTASFAESFFFILPIFSNVKPKYRVIFSRKTGQWNTIVWMIKIEWVQNSSYELNLKG